MKKLLLATVAATAVSFGAQAAPLGGPATFPAALFLNVFTGGLLNVGSTVTPSGTGFTTSPGTGDFVGLGLGSGNPISGVTGLGTLTAGATDLDFTLNAFGDFNGTPSTSSIFLDPTSTATSRTVSFFIRGEFTPTSPLFTAGPASVTGSFTQTGGSGSAVSFSFTFASPPAPPPPPPPVPAPAALLLLGAGLLGLGLVRARKA